MRIAYFTNFYLPIVNGVVRSVETYRRALTRLGHVVFVFAQADGEDEGQVPFVFRYPSLPLPVQVDVPAVIPVSPFVDQLLPALKLELIHTHHPVLLGQTAAVKAEEFGAPLVFTFHTQYREYTHYLPLPQQAVQSFLKETIENWLKDFMRRCQHIVVPSESMKEILVRDYGLQDRYTVIPTGIDLDPFASASGEEVRAREGWGEDRVLISVGRLAREKNWQMLLQAVARARQHHPDLHLVLVGDGPEKSALQGLAMELGLSGRVTFTGELPFDQVAAYLKAADLFGFASVTETQGLVTLEAMAAGLPVVAVEASGTRDILKHGQQGYLVPNDVDALAGGIQRMLDSPEHRQRFSERALETARRFSSDRLARKMTRVYEQAVRDKKAGVRVQLREH